MYVKWSQDQYTRDNVSKRERKRKDTKILTTFPYINTPPIFYANPSPMSMTTFISKLLPLFYQVDISSSLGEPSSSSSLASSLPKPSSLLSSDASGDEKEAQWNHPRQPVVVRYDQHRCSPDTTHRWECQGEHPCVQAVPWWPQVSLQLLVEAGGAAVCVWGYLGLSCAALRRTVAASMAHRYVKWGDSR